MSDHAKYIMENKTEVQRLELKTDLAAVHEQASSAGIQPGMRVVDVGCGPGKTTRALHDMIQPGGITYGLDRSAERIAYATKNYSTQGLNFVCCDVFEDLEPLGQFDFIWVRFFLEYYRSRSFEIVKKLSQMAKPGGILCLIDLDYNSMNHFGMSERLTYTLGRLTEIMEQKAGFDPRIGIKLYSFLYDLGFEEIHVKLLAHHLIYGELKPHDAFNWSKKIETAVRNSGYTFKEYEGGYEEFFDEFMRFFSNPRRFTYTPLIICSGRNPS